MHKYIFLILIPRIYMYYSRAAYLIVGASHCGKIDEVWLLPRCSVGTKKNSNIIKRLWKNAITLQVSIIKNGCDIYRMYFLNVPINKASLLHSKRVNYSLFTVTYTNGLLNSDLIHDFNEPWNIPWFEILFFFH